MRTAEPLDLLDVRLTKCLSTLKAELDSNAGAGYTDAHKRSEVIVRDLMNILYDRTLKLEAKGNSAGFDLYDQDNMLMVQVTSEQTIGKIRDCLEKTAARVEMDRSLRGCDLQIVFLSTLSSKTANLRKSAAQKLAMWELDLSAVSFHPDIDILDLNSFLQLLRENHISQKQMSDIYDLIQKYWPHICAEAGPSHRVQEIIDLYIDHFKSPLFMHSGNSSVTLKNLYVEPGFTDSGNASTITELFEDFIWNQDREKILFIEGGAAIGKTSLVSWLCYHHANPLESHSAGRTIFRGLPIVAVRLRELDFPDHRPSVSALLAYLGFSSARDFSSEFADAVVILDGADELGLVSHVKNNAIEAFILAVRQTLGINKLIVTSRPQFLNLANLSSFHAHVRHITLEHFSQIKRAQWVERYRNTGQTIAAATAEYILAMTDRDADGVADTPLALYLLADCQIREDYKSNPWALYHAIFSEAILKAPYNAGLPGSAPLLSSEYAAQNYDMVKQIAFRMFRNTGSERYYITSEELDEAARDAGLEGTDAERVKQTCVLCAYWKNHRTGALEFYHNNIRDYFLCEYICDRFCRALESFSANRDWALLIEECCSIFCHAHVAGLTWSMICYRLRAEADSLWDRGTLYAVIAGLPVLRSFVWRFLESKTIWRYPYAQHPYQCVKQLVFNVLILFHIFHTEILRDIPNEAIDEPFQSGNIHLFSPDSHDMDTPARTLVRDWLNLLQDYHHIPPIGKLALLSNTDFHDCYWKTVALRHAEFTNSHFHAMRIQNSILERSGFEDAYLSEILFYKGILDNVAFRGTSIVGSSFMGTRFDSCVLDHALFSKTKLHSIHFESTEFYDVRFIDVQFINCHIQGPGSCFSGCTFKNVRTHGCTFRDVDPVIAATLCSIGFTEQSANEIRKETHNDPESDSV